MVQQQVTLADDIEDVASVGEPARRERRKRRVLQRRPLEMRLYINDNELVRSDLWLVRMRRSVGNSMCRSLFSGY